MQTASPNSASYSYEIYPIYGYTGVIDLGMYDEMKKMFRQEFGFFASRNPQKILNKLRQMCGIEHFQFGEFSFHNIWGQPENSVKLLASHPDFGIAEIAHLGSAIVPVQVDTLFETHIIASYGGDD